MDSDFIRRLIIVPTEEELELLVTSLLDAGIETFSKGEEASKYHSSMPGDIFLEREIFVSAADYEAGVSLMKELGYEDKIALCSMVDSSKDRISNAQDEFMKKRKMIWIECAVVVVLVLIYMIYKTM